MSYRTCYYRKRLHSLWIVKGDIPHIVRAVYLEYVVLQSSQEIAQFVEGMQDPNKWHKVGIELGVKEHDLDSLDSQSLGDPIRCFIGVFSMWKNGRATKEFKWNTITEVLEAPGVGEGKLAMDLKLRLPHFKPTVTTITQEFIKEEN